MSGKREAETYRRIIEIEGEIRVKGNACVQPLKSAAVLLGIRHRSKSKWCDMSVPGPR